MTPSETSPDHELTQPGVWRSIRRLAFLSYKTNARLMLTSVILTIIASLFRPLAALCVASATGALVAQDMQLVVLWLAGLVLAICASWIFAIVSDRVSRIFRDLMMGTVETRIAELLSSIPTVEHQERPTHLSRLSVLRQQAFMIDNLFGSMVKLVSWSVQISVVAILLSTISPWLPFVVVAAIPVGIVSVWKVGAEHSVFESVDHHRRLADHLYDLGTTAGAAKDVRTAAIGESLAAERTAAWARWFKPLVVARRKSAVLQTACWFLFASVYSLGAVTIVITGGSAEALVLLIGLGLQLSDYVAVASAELGFVTGTFVHSARRLVWLEDYTANQLRNSGSLPTPSGPWRTGIELRNLDFTYPGSSSQRLRRVSVRFPPGSITAIVGENGAGKSTVVKLLGKLYVSPPGQIFVEGVDLREIDSADWRANLSGSFQESAHFELIARLSVGVGDLGRSSEPGAVESAVERGLASETIARLPDELQTQLGPQWPNGVGLSEGQWKRIALARAAMRMTANLVLLDEPAAPLDPEAEDQLIQGLLERALDARERGAIVIIVSHRYSTVRMADSIIVLNGGEVAEVGSHEKLMRDGMGYALTYQAQQKLYET